MRLIYIRAAHPKDGWWLGGRLHGIRTYVDEVDDPVCKAYNARPTRLFLVGLDGRVVYRGGPVPVGFSPKALDEAIESYLNTREQDNA